MSANENCFVEWKEQYISKERGNRVVHYFLKDDSGDSILAVVGTERSVRHMFYVVSEEFLSSHGGKNSVHAGFRWRSRREVVNWLTSMLSKQHRQCEYSMSPKDEPTSEIIAPQKQVASLKGRLTRNLKGHHLDMKWSGDSWSCGKQLKHYPAFCRNGVSIAVQSFVLVMAEKEENYVAYVEDMYEDKKRQKKVKVRWFHHNEELGGTVSLQNPHPKEVFITPYVQVISAECVDAPAIVLTHQHYEKCLVVFPHDLVRRMHFCDRQFKNNRVKPFKLSNLQGYFDQPIFSCFSSDFFEEEFSSEDDVKAGCKRSRVCKDHDKSSNELSCQNLKYDLLRKKPCSLNHIEGHFHHTPIFNPDEKVEFLCQDSGMRGCWFKCSIVEVSKRQIKIAYNDVKDGDSGINLEEWIPIHRVAKDDNLGMRHPGRPTVRPVYPGNERNQTYKIGDAVDAWWSDGWWEGLVCDTINSKSFRIYIPGENLYLNADLKNLRVSRDWIGGHWMDIEPNPDLLHTIPENGFATSMAVYKDIQSSDSPTCRKVVSSHKLATVLEEMDDLAGMTLTNVPLKDDYINDEQEQVFEAEDKDIYMEHVHDQGEDTENVEDNDLIDAEVKVVKIEISPGLDSDAGKGEDNIDNGKNDNNTDELKRVELKSEEETLENLPTPTSTEIIPLTRYYI